MKEVETRTKKTSVDSVSGFEVEVKPQSIFDRVWEDTLTRTRKRSFLKATFYTKTCPHKHEGLSTNREGPTSAEGGTTEVEKSKEVIGRHAK